MSTFRKVDIVGVLRTQPVEPAIEPYFGLFGVVVSDPDPSGEVVTVDLWSWEDINTITTHTVNIPVKYLVLAR